MAHDGASGELLDPCVGVGQQRLVNRSATARSDAIGCGRLFRRRASGVPFAWQAEAGVSTELAGRSLGTILESFVRRSVDACFAMAEQSRYQSDGSLLTVVRTRRLG